MLTSYIKNWFFQSKVQAELLAQCHDQALVNSLCHRQRGVEVIFRCRTDFYFSRLKIAPFMAVVCLLQDTLEDRSAPTPLQEKAAELLIERLIKVDSDPLFKDIHKRIIDPAEESIERWMTQNPESLKHLR